MCILEWDRIEIANVKQLPLTRGCYAVISEGIILYIGRAKLLWRRIGRIKEHKIIQKIMNDGNQIMIAYSTEDYENEQQLIEQHKPKYNIAHAMTWEERMKDKPKKPKKKKIIKKRQSRWGFTR